MLRAAQERFGASLPMTDPPALSVIAASEPQSPKTIKTIWRLRVKPAMTIVFVISFCLSACKIWGLARTMPFPFAGGGGEGGGVSGNALPCSGLFAVATAGAREQTERKRDVPDMLRHRMLLLPFTNGQRSYSNAL
jgi:hypothetical protein